MFKITVSKLSWVSDASVNVMKAMDFPLRGKKPQTQNLKIISSWFMYLIKFQRLQVKDLNAYVIML